MPNLTLVGLSAPVWDAQVSYPVPLPQDDVAAGLNWSVQAYAKYSGGVRMNTNTGYNPITTASVVGGSVSVLSNYRGIRCERATGQLAYLAGFPWWNPFYGVTNPGGGWVAPWSSVAVFDFNVALQNVAFAYIPDTTGYWWLPNNTTGLVPNPRLGVPGGAGPVGGFGWCINDDGTGACGFEFLSADAAGLVTSRTPAPAGAVADVRDWTHVRVIIESGQGATPALLQAEINGAQWMQDVPFDDITFFRPGTLYPAHATAYNLDRCVGDVAGVNHFYSAVSVRWGSTLPSGAPHQLP